MGHTNSTVNYNLPQFVGTDKPSWLGDVNGAFLAIDTAIAAAKTEADSAAGGVAGLQVTVGGHTTQIGTLTDTVTAQGGTLNSVTALIGNGTPTTTDQTIIGAINELHKDINNLNEFFPESDLQISATSVDDWIVKFSNYLLTNGIKHYVGTAIYTGTNQWIINAETGVTSGGVPKVIATMCTWVANASYCFSCVPSTNEVVKIQMY